MNIITCANKQDLGKQAATEAADALRATLAERGRANLIVATGASQFDTLAFLVKAEGIAWHKVTAFHLDEYVGLPLTHPASFRGYLWQRFVRQLPVPLAAFHYIDGQQNLRQECDRLAALIRACPIDVALVGIGENGHLAFNDPPADFETESPYLVVNLDEDCRRQQMGEGWFPTLEDVPAQAISMSIRQILLSRRIICSVPDRRKAVAVRNTIEGDVTNTVPASAMKKHPAVSVYLDPESASLLSAR